MRQVREVLRLKHVCGHSGHQIAAMIGVSRYTVAEYLRRAARGRHHLAGAAGTRRRGAGAQAVHAALHAAPRCCGRSRSGYASMPSCAGPASPCCCCGRSTGPGNRTDTATAGSATSTRRGGAGCRRRCARAHPAGERLFVDYAGQTVEVIDAATGEVRAAQIFVAALGASNLTYAEARWTQGLPDWIGCHVNAFASFGGVARQMVCDNLKAGVTAASRYEPGISRTYQDMASALRHRRAAGAGAPAARQGQGRGGGAGRAALGAGPAAAPPVLLAGRTERRDPRTDGRAQCPADAPSRHQPSGAVRSAWSGPPCWRCRPNPTPTPSGVAAAPGSTTTSRCRGTSTPCPIAWRAR